MMTAAQAKVASSRCSRFRDRTATTALDRFHPHTCRCWHVSSCWCKGVARVAAAQEEDVQVELGAAVEMVAVEAAMEMVVAAAVVATVEVVTEMVEVVEEVTEMVAGMEVAMRRW